MKKTAARFLMLILVLHAIHSGPLRAATAEEAAPAAGTQVLTLTGQAGGAARALEIEGGVAYIGIGPRLHVVDLQATEPTAAMTAPQAANIEALAVAGEYAYLAAGPACLIVVNLDDLQDPVIVNSLPLVTYAVGVAVLGGRLYLAGAEGVVAVVDISRPATPLPLGQISDLGQVSNITVSGSFLLVARGFGGLDAFRLDEGDTPLPVSHSASPALSLATVGDYVSVGSDFLGGMQLLALDEAGTLTSLGGAPTGSLVNDAVAMEIGAHPYVALALAGGGWSLLDLDRPAAPTLLLDAPLPGAATAVSFANGMLYLLDESSGLRWYDMADPTEPQLRGSYGVPGVVTHVAGGPDILVALDGAGLHVLAADGTQRGRLDLAGSLQNCSWTAALPTWRRDRPV